MLENLFVYGSLREGYHNHLLITTDKYLYKGITFTKDSFVMVDRGESPTVFECPVKEIGAALLPVMGELYSVSKKTLRMLDAYLKCPTSHQRIKVQVEDHRSAWMYVGIDPKEMVYPIANPTNGYYLW